MSNKQIENLTVRLLQALDKNYDVVHMDAVVSVISALENTTITKEQLEATRLAKYINLFRRRTRSEQLAKRAKSLLKKWREMVGMQQQQQQQQQQTLGVHMETRRSDIRPNSFQQTLSPSSSSINLIDDDSPNQNIFTRSKSSNLSLNSALKTSCTETAASDIYRSETFGDGAIPHAISGSNLQPTSFANVLTTFDESIPGKINSNSSYTQQQKSQQNIAANGPRRKSRNIKNLTNPRSTATAFNINDGFNIENTTNSNSAINYGTPAAATTPTKSNITSEPIIIDIEDSNSGPTLNDLIPSENADNIVELSNKPVKHKKAKKEKKRTRERESTRDTQYTPLVVIDGESSQSQHSQNRRKLNVGNSGTTDNILPGCALEDKSRSSNLMATNISEILSLSNSSISSVFPSSLAKGEKSKNANKQQQNTELKLNSSDLSFAGKFSQQSSALTTQMPCANNNNKTIFPDIDNSCSIPPKISHSSNKFQTFVGSAYNSNDSASNSRHSNFEIVDNVSLSRNILSTSPKLELNSSAGMAEMQRKIATSMAINHNNNLLLQQQQQLVKSSVRQSATSLPVLPNHASTEQSQVTKEERMPKKRGRKKGSKGVDSLIANEKNYASQSLIQTIGTGCKKVKTTKELYAEIQSRKLGVSTPTTPSHWTSAPSQTTAKIRRDSFCSEPSLHSPRTYDACLTNITTSTTTTNSSPPEKNFENKNEIDSGSDTRASGCLSHESVALPTFPKKTNSSKSSTSKIAISTQSSTKPETNDLITAESNLCKLIQKLPIVPSILQIEHEASANIIPCKCRIVEIMPETQIETKLENKPNDLLSIDDLKVEEAQKLDSQDEMKKPFLTINIKEDEGAPNSKLKTATAKPLQLQQSNNQTKLDKPIKSIFDLDFDDDEDPLHSLIAEVAAANNSTNINSTKTEIVDEKQIADIKSEFPSEQQENMIDQQQQEQPDSAGEFGLPHLQPNFMLLPTYKIEEEPNCPAKERFELQTQKITKFHIQALHNLYIPNINGNWDDVLLSPTQSFNDEEKSKAKQEEDILDGSRVVPKYICPNANEEEHIRKDLREITFQQCQHMPKLRTKQLYKIPFLGVARCKKRRRNENLSLTDKEVAKDSPANAIKDQAINDTFPGTDASVNVADELESTQSTQFSKSHIFEDITININDDQTCSETQFAPAANVMADFQPNLLTIASSTNLNDAYEHSNHLDEDPYQQRHSEASGPQSYDVDETKTEAVSSNQQAAPLYDNSGDINTNDNDNFNNNDNCNNKNSDDNSSSSSCESHSSLKQTQKSINLKLRRHRRLLLEQEQNSPRSYTKRKRRRKKSGSRKKRPKIKCIRIAINGGGIATQRQIPFDDDEDNSGSSSESYDEDENEEHNTSTDTDDDDEVAAFEELDNQSKFIAKADGENDHEVLTKQKSMDLADNATCDYEDDYDEEPCVELDDDEEDEDYTGDFHEVITRDISPTTSAAFGNNHIVLTIKKTPSKLNSPTNPSATSPSTIKTQNILLPLNNNNNVEALDIIANEVVETTSPGSATFESKTTNPIVITSNTNNTTKEQQPNPPQTSQQSSSSFTFLKGNAPLRYQRRRRLKRRISSPFKKRKEGFRFPDETKSQQYCPVFKKIHQQIFFPHEIYQETQSGHQKRIFNMSSCESSCAEDNDYDDESEADVEANSNSRLRRTSRSKQDDLSINRNNSNSSSNSSSSSSDLSDEDDDDEAAKTTYVLSNDNVGFNEELPEENNCLLTSFNEIGTTAALTTTPKTSKGEESPKESTYKPLKEEYSKGIRAATAEDVNGSDGGESLEKLQHFKEWHQVLQLKSYNNELLTVLPYVVLD